MKRSGFLKQLLASGAGLSLLPLVAQTKESSSTYDKLMNQVGFNHIPNKENKTMKSVLHKATTRGHANHGWLDSHHTFSFANYYNPERMNFGVLRVLNDDRVNPGQGFGTHPHDNMEIISIPLSGDLEHKDSKGNTAVIREGDVQVMSAGTGIFHSEYNRNKDEEVKFLQIWMFPNKKNVEPRYDQISIADIRQKNAFYQILSPNKQDQGVWVHQDAWWHLGDFEPGKTASYDLKKPGNGMYVFVLKGSVNINGQQLNARDGYGMWDTTQFNMEATENSRLLLMEVPMSV